MPKLFEGTFETDVLSLRADTRAAERRQIAARELVEHIEHQGAPRQEYLNVQREILLAQVALDASLWRAHSHFIANQAAYFEAAQAEDQARNGR